MAIASGVERLMLGLFDVIVVRWRAGENDGLEREGSEGDGLEGIPVILRELMNDDRGFQGYGRLGYGMVVVVGKRERDFVRGAISTTLRTRASHKVLARTVATTLSWSSCLGHCQPGDCFMRFSIADRGFIVNLLSLLFLSYA